MTSERRGDVAVFIDFENIYISVRNQYDANPNFESIMEQCQTYGRVTISRAYADWYRYPRVTNALYANAIEPMYVPTYHYDREEGRTGRAIKNSVDMHLCIDMMKTLYAYPTIETYVLITGDRDFIPLVNAARQQGKRIVVIGVAHATATHLAQAADEFLSYSQVVEDVESAAAKDARDPFTMLVEAVKLARQRGHVSTFATLKLLMLELMPSFDEGRITDKGGKGFGKFKDFVRDAERRKLVKVYTSGSVTEVLLPDEDPYKVSQFAPEKAAPAAPVRESAPSRSRAPARVSTQRPVSAPPPAPEPEPGEEDEDDLTDLELTRNDWAVFEEAMTQFDQPVLFIQVYDGLRNLRNKEIMNLSNHDIKRMIKLAINEGLVQRITRGSHAYYKMNTEVPFLPAEHAEPTA